MIRAPFTIQLLGQLWHLAEVAPDTFTTIEPNIGPGWYASPTDEDSNSVDPLHGWSSEGSRDGRLSAPAP
jgi:hypothetical protein